MSADGNNPEYATSLMRLAAARQSQGRHAEALDLREKALAFRRRVLPADHPDIAAASASRGNCGRSSTHAGSRRTFCGGFLMQDRLACHSQIKL